MMKNYGLRAVCLVMVGLFVLCGGVAYSQSKDNLGLPWDALIQLSSESVGAGIGLSWGSGTLTQAGKEYPLKVEGLSVGTVGIAKATALGKVYNLKQLSDINGTYAAIGAGATVGGGGAGITMKNANGVIIDAVTTSEGIKFAIGTSGVTITLKQ
ncbi:MAG: hypothetical protein ACLP2X_15825 [Syntrophobacteraceae bacterium]